MIDAWMQGRGGASGAEADFFTKNRVRGTLRAIQFIADHLARVPGRKNLIWLSGGFPLTLGFESIAAMTDPSRDHETFTREITECIRAVNNANLAIYPVDARGLMVDPRFNAENRSANFKVPQRAPGQREQESMQELASRTGGRAFMNTNDLSKAIRAAVNDTSVTYTIGYYPSDDQFDGTFHTIKVKVSRPGVSMRYRKGYFDLPEQPQNDAARKTELADAVFSPLDATEIGLTVERKPVGAQPGVYEYALRVDPKGVSLQQQGDRWAGQLDVLFVQKDNRGRQYNGEDSKVSMRLTEPNYRKLSTEGIVFRRNVTRVMRATELRIVVRDAASGSVGSVTVPFDASK